MFGKIVYTGGTFDLIHAGHIYLLEYCRVLAGTRGKVVVALNDDDFVMRYKGFSPSQPFGHRKRILNSMKFIDVVVKNIGGEDSKPAIEMVGPDYIVIGQDWQGKDYHSQMQFTPEWLDERRITLVYAPLLENWSSSRIRKELRDGYSGQ